ncbi:MAG TPA: CocE/NonD family hydrolase [Gaiellaceae bacterium]
MGVVAWDRLPRPVREVDHLWIELADGTRLAARIWLPRDAEADPVPAILEYLPYRKHDGTAVRDSVRQPYVAGHGYACVRVDIRGSGDSDGILEDEYTRQELDDALEVIAWLAEQPWCSGAVGMTGISWGGFNALQVAALQPPALGAVVTLCSTDDRYADDVHYRGGCVLASDMLHWASSMLVWNARPPDPRVLPDTWRERWLDRLEHTPPYIEPWLGHQRRDAYWKHGSVCEDYGAIQVPVYAVGGWADGYTNAVFRLLEGLRCPRKGLVGPWAHAFPDDAAPGPSIGWLQETVRWWDQWLKGVETGIMDEPMLRLFVLDSVVPAPSYELRAGRWATEAEWPSPRIERRRFELPVEAPVTHTPSQALGTEAGVWCAGGQSADLPADQRPDDALSASLELPPLEEPLELAGFPAVELELAADRPAALVCVRLCDVFPDGTSALVTRGLLNLTHRDGHEHPEPLEPGRRCRVRVELDSIAYSVPTGHRLRVAVSSTYWPWAWPSPEPVTLTLHGGVLDLPVRPPSVDDAPPFAAPEHTPILETKQQTPSADGRRLERDFATGRIAQHFDYDVGGTVRLVDLDLVSEDTNHTVYSIVEGDPLSAEVAFHATTGIARDGWSGRAEATATMRADLETFYVTTELTAYEDGDAIFARVWEHRFPRDHV